MSHNPKSRPKPDIDPDNDFVITDFDPAENLAKALAGRPLTEGVTIDSRRAQIIDDGFWRHRNRAEGGWSIQTSIADVPAIMPDDSALAQHVTAKFQDESLVLLQKKKGETQIRNFPFALLNDHISLHQGAVRPVLSFDVELGHDFRLTSYTIARKAFRNLHKCDHDDLATQYKPIRDQVKSWYKMSNTMAENRVFDVASACDSALGYADSDCSLPRLRLAFNHANQSECLVQEMMRLTNAVAGDFVAAHNLTVPVMPQNRKIIIEYVSPNPAFDAECDVLAEAVIARYSNSCQPKIRVTSPMRLYSDYVTMKIMARELDGLAESAGLRDEALRLSAIFQKAAAEKPFSPKHMADLCIRKRAQQGGEHPFSFLTRHDGDAASLRLDSIKRPNVAVRTLHVPGGEVFLVGLLFPQDGKKSWAIAHNYETAREQAATRMLRLMSQIPQSLCHR
ncbi:MAG: hypothetical protein JWO78_1925 [Micavibrio sp.]|nr:hypothetical protein [Micavibrio sp.]